MSKQLQTFDVHIEGMNQLKILKITKPCFTMYKLSDGNASRVWNSINITILNEKKAMQQIIDWSNEMQRTYCPRYIEIKVYDADLAISEEWKIFDANITDVSFGELNSRTSYDTYIDVTLYYSSAELL